MRWSRGFGRVSGAARFSLDDSRSAEALRVTFHGASLFSWPWEDKRPRQSDLCTISSPDTRERVGAVGGPEGVTVVEEDDGQALEDLVRPHPLLHLLHMEHPADADEQLDVVVVSGAERPPSWSGLLDALDRAENDLGTLSASPLPLTPAFLPFRPCLPPPFSHHLDPLADDAVAEADDPVVVEAEHVERVSQGDVEGG
eukprot:758784-Hanusia_phi.AAC.6